MLTGFPPPTGAGGSAARNPGRRRGSSWLLRFTEACLVLHIHTTCIRGEQDGPLFDTPALLSSKARILVENNQSDLSDEAGLQKGHLSSHLPSISHDGLLSRRRAHVAVEKPAWGDKDRLVQGTSERHPEGAAVSITFRTPGGVANQETRFSCCIRGLVEGVEYQVLVTVCRGASIILYHESLLDRAPSIFLYDFNITIPPLPVDNYTIRVKVFDRFRGSSADEDSLLSTLTKVFRVEQDRETHSSSTGLSTRKLCLLDGECFKHDQLGIAAKNLVQHDDSDFAYRAWGVGSSADACLARARQWHLYCGNPFTTSMTATYVPTSDSYTFPDGDTRMGGERGWVLLLHVTDGYLDFFDNFWKHYQKIDRWSVPHVVKVIVASDATARYMREVYGEKIEVGVGSYVGQQPLGFWSRGFTAVVQERASLILKELFAGRNVLYLDVDIVLREDPFPFLITGYDMWTSMDHEGVTRTRAQGTAHCTGVLAMLATPRIIQFVLDWDDRMRNMEYVGNQKAFNDLIQSPDNKDINVIGLCKMQFPPGSLYFSPEFASNRAQVVAVHNNYLIGHQRKKQRFIDHGLWIDKVQIEATPTEQSCLSTGHLSWQKAVGALVESEDKGRAHEPGQGRTHIKRLIEENQKLKLEIDRLTNNNSAVVLSLSDFEGAHCEPATASEKLCSLLSSLIQIQSPLADLDDSALDDDYEKGEETLEDLSALPSDFPAFLLIPRSEISSVFPPPRPEEVTNGQDKSKAWKEEFNVTVVLNPWHRPKLFKQQLEAIREQTFPVTQVFVTLSASPARDALTTTMQEVCEAWNMTCFLVNSDYNFIYYLPWQVALQATTRYVWFLDDDVLPGRHALAFLLHVSNTQPYRDALLGGRGTCAWPGLLHHPDALIPGGRTYRDGWEYCDGAKMTRVRESENLDGSRFMLQKHVKLLFREEPGLGIPTWYEGDGTQQGKWLSNDFQLTYVMRKYAGRKSFVLPCSGAPEMCIDSDIFIGHQGTTTTGTRVVVRTDYIYHMFSRGAEQVWTQRLRHARPRSVMVFVHSLAHAHTMARVREALLARGVANVYVTITGQVLGESSRYGKSLDGVTEQEMRQIFGYTSDDVLNQRVGFFSLKIGSDYPSAHSRIAMLTETLTHFAEVIRSTRPRLVLIPLLSNHAEGKAKDQSTSQETELEAAAIKGAELAAESEGVTVAWVNGGQKSEIELETEDDDFIHHHTHGISDQSTSNESTGSRAVGQAHEVSMQPFDADRESIKVDMVVVGTGGWGLACLRIFCQLGMTVVSLEKDDVVGGAFKMWSSKYPPWIRLHTKFRYLKMSEHSLGEEWEERRPTIADLIEYYQSFVEHHGLVKRIRFNSTFTSVSGAAGNYTVHYCNQDGKIRTILTRFVVIATGGLSEPVQPYIPDVKSNPNVHRYIVNDVIPDPEAMWNKTVLVVGGGYSGADSVRTFCRSNRVLWVTRKTQDALFEMLHFRNENLGAGMDFLDRVEVFTQTVVRTIIGNVAHLEYVWGESQGSVTFDACFLMLGYDFNRSFLEHALDVPDLELTSATDGFELASRPGIYLVGGVRSLHLENIGLADKFSPYSTGQRRWMHLLRTHVLRRFAETTQLLETHREIESQVLDHAELSAGGHHDGGRERAECLHEVQLEIGSEKVDKAWVCTHDPKQDHVSRLLHNHGTYYTIQDIKTVCASGLVECDQRRTFVDVGAGIGYLSIFAASMGMTVHAVEPIEENIRLLGLSLRKNHLTQLVSIYQAGIFPNSASRNNFTVHTIPGNFHATSVDSVMSAVLGVQHGPSPANSSVRGIRMADVSQDIELMALNCQGCEHESLVFLDQNVSNVRGVLLLIYLKGFSHKCTVRHAESRMAIKKLRHHGFCFYDLRDMESAVTKSSLPRPIIDVDRWQDDVIWGRTSHRLYFFLFASRLNCHQPSLVRSEKIGMEEVIFSAGQKSILDEKTSPDYDSILPKDWLLNIEEGVMKLCMSDPARYGTLGSNNSDEKKGTSHRCTRGSSQALQDLVLQYIFDHIEVTNKFYVEMGFDSIEREGGACGSNTYALWKSGWHGLLMDVDNENLRINLRKEKVSPQNVASLLWKYRVPHEPDYISIDIDGPDLWVLRNVLKDIRPRVVTVEYNPNYLFSSTLTFPDPSWEPAEIFENLTLVRNGKLTAFYGASIGALRLVAHEFGYHLVHRDHHCDVFLIRRDLIGDAYICPWGHGSLKQTPRCAMGDRERVMNDYKDRTCPEQQPMEIEDAVLLVDYQVWITTLSLEKALHAAWNAVWIEHADTENGACFAKVYREYGDMLSGTDASIPAWPGCHLHKNRFSFCGEYENETSLASSIRKSAVPRALASNAEAAEMWMREGVLVLPSLLWGCPTRLEGSLLHNQGAMGGATEDRMEMGGAGAGEGSQCERQWYSAGPTRCGVARRRPTFLLSSLGGFPVLRHSLLQDVCRNIRSIFHRLHQGQMIWDGKERPAYFPFLSRTTEMALSSNSWSKNRNEIASRLPDRRSLMLESLLPMLEGGCEKGHKLERLGGEACGLSYCDGTKHICVPDAQRTLRTSDLNQTFKQREGNPGDRTKEGCVIYSFGSNKEISFEQDLHLFWPACHIHVFDCYAYPPGSSKSQPVPNARMTFHGFCLDAVDDPATGRYTFQSITMALGHESQDITLLKMDIEGWEWFFFQQLAARATADFQPRILQITFELHLRILGTYPEIQMGSVDMANLVALLLRLGYRFITWVPNAAFLGIDVAELTLVLDS